MDDALYNAAFEAIEPIMERYLDLKASFYKSRPTQEVALRAHAEYVAERDAALVPFGVTFEQLEQENLRRLDEKYAEK